MVFKLIKNQLGTLLIQNQYLYFFAFLFFLSCQNAKETKKYYKNNYDVLTSDLRGNDPFSILQDALMSKQVVIEEINKMFIEDQKYREGFYNKGAIKDSTEALNKVDYFNQLKLEKIMKKYGWPSSDEFPDTISYKVFIMMIHYPVNYRKLFLDDLKEKVNNQKASAKHYAVLYDLTLIEEGKDQEYGTNFGNDKHYINLSTIKNDELIRINKNRSKINLSPLMKSKLLLNRL